MTWQPIKTAPKEFIYVQDMTTGSYPKFFLKSKSILLSDGKVVWEDYWAYIPTEEDDFNLHWFNHWIDFQGDNPVYGKPTHWMPLPAPPVEGGAR